MRSLILAQNFNAGSECSKYDYAGLIQHTKATLDVEVRVFLKQFTNFESPSSIAALKDFFFNEDLRSYDESELKLLVTNYLTEVSL